MTTAYGYLREALQVLAALSSARIRRRLAQVTADPVGRLIWASPALPRARHDAGAAAEHTLPTELSAARITTDADSAYDSVGSTIRAPFRKSRYDKATGKFVSRRCPQG